MPDRARPSDGYDVLVVGSGPTGLLAACELIRRGVRVRVIDRALQSSSAPRALSLWPRALDILAGLGLAESVRAQSLRIDAFSYYSDRAPLASFRFSPDLASRILPQPVTERLLTERLCALGGRIERGVRLLCIYDEDSSARVAASAGVSVLLEHVDGTLERTRVPYLVGADGAGSTVRGQIGVGFQGSTYERGFALIDARIEGFLPSEQVSYYQAPGGTLVLVPQPDGVFRFLTALPPAVTEVSVAMMQSMVDDHGPRGVRIAEPVWQTAFRVHARQATDFQRGRVFLMGDAAHVHSPAGGQGLNNGLQDAHNLAWKLAAVISGDSPASLLDSYTPERAAATRRIVRDTDVQTRAWMVNGRLGVIARDAAFRALGASGAVSHWYTPVMAGRRLAYPATRQTQHPARPAICAVRRRLPGGVKVGAVFPPDLAATCGIRGGGEMSAWTLAVLSPAGDTSWLSAPQWLAASRPRLRITRITASAAAADLGCQEAGYYLVRPDGHIAAHGHRADLDRLRWELDQALVPVVADRDSTVPPLLTSQGSRLHP
jgi:2-polyprenyl-6-methoxyphenol hydroxylase-like FAD-dependent oxidoreductase